jgi:hypothetical protein
MTDPKPTARAIFDSAPLGAIIRYHDGTPKPPARFSRKVQAWERSNGSGQLVKKEPASRLGTYEHPASFTLFKGDFGSNGIVLIKAFETFRVTSPLQFEVTRTPPVGSVRVLSIESTGTSELIHLAPDQASADAWIARNGCMNVHTERCAAPAGAMNPCQAAVARAYASGEFAHYAVDPDWRTAIENCGDGLFRFLMIELSTTEDCHTVADAVQRLRSAYTDLATANAAIAALTRRFTYLQDPGHGWLMVTKQDLEAFGLSPSDFTPYSYVSADRLALEEDLDMGRFLQRLEQLGVPYELDQQHINHSAYVRNWLSNAASAAA